MLDEDEDLDQMSPERLRELKQEVLLRIEEIGSGTLPWSRSAPMKSRNWTIF